MKYIALIYSDPARQTPPDSPEFGKMMAGYQVCNSPTTSPSTPPTRIS
ncbi:hypothetical protein [Pseudohoeflea suaedae]|nr:hypothetical protein [Pseudohoeflea suaedae]